MDRVRAACAKRPMLASMLVGAEVASESGDVVTVSFSPTQRAAAAAHLAELKPFFIEATGRRGLEIVVEGVDEEEASAPSDDGAVQAIRPTRADAGLDHPLVRQVAELFDATPKRVEQRSKG